MASTAQFDVVIRGGEIHDGTGAAGQTADVAIRDGRIAQIGQVRGHGTEEIDAQDRIVTPGFVDIHTHYDGQAVWDDTTAPSAYHGVTTVLMGNCGVGFAPCKASDRDSLISLMEGVEDIPGPVMHEGLSWDWVTFAEYLDVLDRTPRDIDICALIPHAPVRVYVMGERALRLLPATPDEIAEMRRIVADGVRAGAFGVSTSRTMSHQSKAGDYTPTLLAREQEIVGLAMGMTDAGRGLFEFVTELHDPDVIGEFETVRRALKKAGRPGVYSLSQSSRGTSDVEHLWRDLLKYSEVAKDDGVTLRPVVPPRAVGVLLGLEASQNPFSWTTTYSSIASLPLAERVRRMRDPEVRQQILGEDRFPPGSWPALRVMPFARMYPFGNPPNYLPDPASSLQATAERQGRPVLEVVYDALLEDDGMAFLYVPFANYLSGDLSVCEEMLADPNSIMGLGDAGAHVGFILDASFQTWMLTFWVRERGTITLPEAVRRMTSDTAGIMGLADRGRIQVGLRADLNVINLDDLAPGPVEIAYDLPNGAKRLMQNARGYEHTIVAGQTVYRNGVGTGARPGRLTRSGQ